MKKDDLGPLGIAAAYIATLMGAGFASGQEMMQFFVAFEKRGIWGLAVTTVLLWGFGYIILSLASKKRATGYEVLLKKCAGGLGTVLSGLTAFFLFCGLTVMTAATGELFSYILGWPYIAGAGLITGLAILIVRRGLSGIIGSFKAVVPLLLLLTALVSIRGIYAGSASLGEGVKIPVNPIIGSWWISALLYVSYNILVALVVLTPLGEKTQSKHGRLLGAGMGALGCGTVAVLSFLALRGNLRLVALSELPMTALAGALSQKMLFLYALTIALSTFTTAVGCLFGLAGRRKWEGGVPLTKILIIGLAAFAASMGGFSRLVSLLYPLSGWLGLVVLAVLLRSWFLQKRAF